MRHEFARRLLLERTVRALLIVVFAPIFNNMFGVIERDKPVLLQALLPQPAVEALDKCIVRWLTRSAEFQLHSVAIRPLVHRLRDEFTPVVDLDDLW